MVVTRHGVNSRTLDPSGHQDTGPLRTCPFGVTVAVLTEVWAPRDPILATGVWGTPVGESEPRRASECIVLATGSPALAALTSCPGHRWASVARGPQPRAGGRLLDPPACSSAPPAATPGSRCRPAAAPRAQCREGRTQELLASLLVPLQNQRLQPGHFQAGPPTGSLGPLPLSPYSPLPGGTTSPSPSPTRAHKPCCPGVSTPQGPSFSAWPFCPLGSETSLER